jgi:hypothetical protein
MTEWKDMTPDAALRALIDGKSVVAFCVRLEFSDGTCNNGCMGMPVDRIAYAGLIFQRLALQNDVTEPTPCH